MEKRILNPGSLAKPVGYANGIVTSGGKLVFLAGQIGMDATGQIAEPGDVVAQFRRALANVKAVVDEAGGSMTDIVKLTIWVTDKAAYKANLKPLGDEYRSFFGRYYPAMTWVEIKSLYDEQAMVEIEGIAIVTT